MKIVILTDNAERHYYFANRILEQQDWEGKVILSGKTMNIGVLEKIRKILKRRPLKWVRNKALDIVFRSYGARLSAEKSVAEAQFFSGQKAQFYEHHEGRILTSVGADDRSLNDARFIEGIRAEKPDAIAVMGTCLVSRAIIESAPLVINMHTGLSPYYRGGQTNFWPYLYGDMDCFGVTVHKMSTGIDSGEIVHSVQIMPEPLDNYASINCKAIVKGTELMIDALKRYKAGELRSLPQWDKGMVFNSDDFNAYHAFRYFRGMKDKKSGVAHRPLKIVGNGKTQDV